MTLTIFVLAVPFLSPGLAAAGAGLASVPIIIHLLNRRRFRRVIWAAMEWLLAAQRKNARRIRIEQLLLLIIRCLIMLLIGLALAQPILHAMGWIGQTRALRVIIIDDSYSMNYGGATNANSPFMLSRLAALEAFKLFDDRDEIMVILAGSPARKLFAEPGVEHRAIMERVRALRPTARGSDLAGAFKLAREVLDRENAPSARHVVLITDRSRSAWQPAGQDSNSPDSLANAIKSIQDVAAMHMIDVGPDVAYNLAITDLSARYAVAGADHQIYVTATIHNFSDVDRDNLSVKLSCLPADAPAGRDEPMVIDVPKIPANSSVQVDKLMPFLQAGFHSIVATLVDQDGQELSDDRLAEDNRRFMSLRIRRRINVRMVDGQPPLPGRKPSESEIFGLRLAFSPVTSPTIVEAERERDSYTLYPDRDVSLRPNEQWLDRQDLLVLANVDLASAAQNVQLADEIEQFVRRGGGLMVFMGTQTDTPTGLKAYNDLLFRDGRGPLPARLIAAIGDASDRAAGQLFDTQKADFAHPVLSDFRAKKEPLRSAEFFRHIKAELPADSRANVLLQFADGDPAIILHRHGKGKVALISSSADGDWNSFYGKPDYLPLFNNLAYYLTLDADAVRNLSVGSPLVEPLTAEQASRQAELLLTQPGPTVANMVERIGARQLTPQPRAQAEGEPADRWQFVVEAADLDLPGLYALQVAPVSTWMDENGNPLPADRVEQLSQFLYAVNPPAITEGDVRPVTLSKVEEFVGQGRVIKPEGLAEARADLVGGSDISRTLLYIVLALCLLETLLAQRFGHFRE